MGTATGDYGHPLHASYWMKQLTIYLIALFFAKMGSALCTAIPYLDDFSAFILSPLAGHTKGLIFFVMFVFPLCANCIQVLFIDEMLSGRGAWEEEARPFIE